MRELPNDDEHADWVRRMREVARADAEAMVPSPDFPVYGLVSGVDGTTDGALTTWERVNDVCQHVELGYGDPLAPGGPLVLVRTAISGDDQPALAEELAREHDRIAEHAGVDDPAPDVPPSTGELAVPVDGRPITGELCQQGPLWVIRLTRPEVVITVIGRGLPVGEVALATVPDLRPAWQRRGRWLGDVVRAWRSRPVPELMPAAGTRAHRALVDYILDVQERELPARRAGQRPRRRAGDGNLWRPLWHRSVAEQRRMTGCGRAEADDAITLMVNHATRLHEEAPWFGRPALRAAAVDEIVRYAVGERVRSEAAQRAWRELWRTSHPTTEPDDRLANHQRVRQTLQPAWLRAWRHWLDNS